MIRTSLGQKNETMKREEVSSIKQIGSAVRNVLQQELWQPTLNFKQQIQQFVYLGDKFFKAESQFNWEVPLGETSMSVKEGFGVCVFKNGDRYIGSWHDNLMQGMGVYIFGEEEAIVRTIYLGEFHQGRFSGIGKLAYFQEGQGVMLYYGTWLEGKKSFKGRYYYQNTQTNYIGFWLNDLKHGEGKLVFPGGQFTGNWVQDQRQGYGKLKKTEENLTVIYEGNWEKDKLTIGKVTYYDLNNSQVGRYQGQLLQGKKHGKGIYYWRGTVYQGQFADDSIKGEGSIRIGKTIFKGCFKSESSILNSPQMKGTLMYQNGDIFEGLVSIRDGSVKRNIGSYNFAIGDAAEGDFQDNPVGDLMGRFLYRWKNGQQRQFS